MDCLERIVIFELLHLTYVVKKVGLTFEMVKEQRMALLLFHYSNAGKVRS